MNAPRPSIDVEVLEAAFEDLARQRSPAGLTRQIKLYLRDVDAQRAPVERQRRLRVTALACHSHFRLHGDARSIERALGFAREAQGLLGPDTSTAMRARILDTLANIQFQRGGAGVLADPAALLEAQSLFEAAIPLLDRHAAPQDWCTVANTLASVHATRYRMEGGAEHAAAACAILRPVRSVAARAGLVAIWADAAGNILRIERDQAYGAGSASQLVRIVRRIRRLLQLIQARGVVAAISQTRHLLAIALSHVADLRYDRTLLEEARSLWQANLAEWPRARSEPEWARIVNSLGLVEMTIGEQENSRAAFERALALFASIADFPSRRHGRSGPRLRFAWSAVSAPESYAYALNNAAGLRESLAALTHTSAPLFDTAEDLEDLQARHPFDDRSLAAMLGHLRARSKLALAKVTRQRHLLEEGDRLAVEAAADLRAIGEHATAAILLTQAGESIKGQLRAPEALGLLARAEVRLDAALEAAGDDPMSDRFITAWRIRAETRLRAAAWRGDAGTAEAVRHEIDRFRDALGGQVSPTQDMLLLGLGLDARSVMARLADRPAAYAELAQGLSQALDRSDLLAPLRLRLLVGLGHAQKRAGRLDAAIAAWSQAQAFMWDLVVGTGDRTIAEAVTCALGQAGHDLMAGGGLSLADELALALLRRGASGDIECALEAVERGRALTASLNRPGDARDIHLRERLRRLDAFERRHASALYGTSGEGARLARLGRLRRAILAELAARLAGAPVDSMPQVNLDAVVACLPDAAVVAVIVLGERDAGVILVGRGAGGQTVTHARMLERTDRRRLDGLVHDFMAAVEALQALGEHVAPSMESYRRSVERFSYELAACEHVLSPNLLTPVRALLDGWDTPVARLCWLVPGVLWPLPLHAMGIEKVPSVQSYGRTLSEIAALSMRRRAPPLWPRRALMVDDPGQDMVVPLRLRSSTRLHWRRLKGRRATARAILKRMREADLVLFHGHGRYVAGDRERSGLLAAPSGAGRPGGDILSINALRDLALGPRDLAIISACDAGSIELYAAVEDFAGIPAELLDAGFGGVLAATWPVEQATSAELMRVLVEALPTAYGDPAAALAQAQARSRATAIAPRGIQRVEASDPLAGEWSPDPADAYWWAGFRMIGF